MTTTSRRAILLASAAALPLAPALTRAQSSPVPTTTPAECLTIETFPVPAGDRPHDVAPAADGRRVWYSGQGAGVAGLLDPESGEVERIPLGGGSSPHGVIVADDGAAWFTDGGLNAIVRLDADSRELDVYPVPGAYANLNTAAFDAEGFHWFTGQSGIVGRLDPATGEIVTLDAPRGRGPYGIDATPDGEIWFVSLAGSYLAKLAVVDGAITLTPYDPPTAGAGCRRVWSDSSGILWISEWNAGQVARFDPASEEWTDWRLPGDNPQAYAVYVDERDDVWVSDFGANSLVRFDPDTETFASVPLPDPDAAVRQILGRPGEVWGAESGAGKLVVVRTACAD